MTTRRRRKIAESETESPRGDSQPDPRQMAFRVVGDDDYSPPAEPLEPAEDEGAPEAEAPPAAAAELPPAPSQKPAGSGWAMRVPQQWGNVVHDVFSLDIDKTFERLQGDLSLGSNVTEYGHVLAALEASTRNAYDAARLVRAAKRADEDFALDVDQRIEHLRSTARAELEAEKEKQKASKGVAKAPTLQEVSDRMLFNWPDEMRQLNGSKGQMHGAFRAIEALEKAWWDRCQTLRQIASRFAARA